MRALLPICAIRFFSIQEPRYTTGNNLTLKGLIGRITTFELSNFDNFNPGKLDIAFSAKLKLDDSKEKKKKKKVTYVESDNESNDEEI